MVYLTEGEKPKFNTPFFGLDHLRSFAVISIFVYHYGYLFPHPDWTRSISKFGWTGVDLFFVLSGFLIASQLFKIISQDGKISLRAFFLNRFFRIVPAYLTVVAIYFLFPVVREREALAPLWKYVTFTQNMALDLRYQGTFSHAWSLCVEGQFYLLFPAILILMVYLKFLKKGLLVLLSFFLLCFLARLFSWYSITGSNFSGISWAEWIYFPTYCRLDGLLTGVFIAAIFQFKPKLKEKLEQSGKPLLLCSILALTAAYFMCLQEQSFRASIFGLPLVALGYGLLVLGAISPTSFLYKFRSKISSKLAKLSFAVYLLHEIIIHLTQTFFSKLNINEEGTFMFLICIVSSLTGAFLLNKIIEVPFLKLKDRLIQHYQAHRATGTSTPVTATVSHI